MPQNQLREHATSIYQSALAAAEPAAAIKKAVSLNGDRLHVGQEVIDLSQYKKIIAVGAGKAGAPMARALEEVLGNRLAAGRVVVKEGHLGATEKIELFEASHPVPDQRGADASAKIMQMVRENAAADTLFICLLSGGGSALFVGPAEGITLADKQETTKLLLAAGADIGEINAIRKHLSLTKGGRLAQAAMPGRVISLIISDVVGDRLDTIASGPTVPDNTTWADAKAIFDRFQIWDKAPAPVRARISAGLAGQIPDTAKPGEESLKGVINHIAAGNRQALLAAAATAKNLGYQPLILSSTIEGETRDVARLHAAIAREIKESGHPIPAPAAVISGGETTVTLGETFGLGGRNMEFALVAVGEIAGLTNLLMLSIGTDGTDGPTDAAGAFCTGQTQKQAQEAGVDPGRFLAGHDAYNFFDKVGGLIKTGPTLTNVMDMRLILVG